MIERRREYTKKAPSRDAHKVYIVCEGSEDEEKYFSFFEGLSSNLKLIVIPSEYGKTDPLKLMERAEACFLAEDRKYTLDYMDRDEVWFVIDTDTWEDEGKIAPLRQFCTEQNEGITQEFDEARPYDAWRVAQSNPSFEIWLYYHFYDASPEKSVVNAAASFKEFVNDSIRGGFDYELDQARLNEAVTNALSCWHEDPQGAPELFSTELHLLGRAIDGFVHGELMKLRNKLGR